MKRCLDVGLAAAGLFALAPLLLGIGIAVKLSSPGPVLFRQARFGLNNRPIMILKFRTMHQDLCDASGANHTTRNDARVTPIGRWLRRASLDELPQLLNVLRGEMSIVGPRPHPIHMKVGAFDYADAVPGYAVRHRVRPGITGWAQIDGLRGEVDSLHKAEQRIRYDLDYIARWSLWLDLQVIVVTTIKIFSEEAY